ncbi:transcriptional regulator [Vogesella oryzae]|uniref:transcriptional regulator n=1 Tax=Vogesella oryzae TaxID=1735285 RepID=UPI00158363B7|nr:YdaS family helix-turn-helix protein [Vogesella oryzae]
MNLSDYFKTARGARSNLASKVGRSPAYLTHVATGFRRASVNLAIAIEQATDGDVSRSSLRPDVWPVGSSVSSAAESP